MQSAYLIRGNYSKLT